MECKYEPGETVIIPAKVIRITITADGIEYLLNARDITVNYKEKDIVGSQSFLEECGLDLIKMLKKE